MRMPSNNSNTLMEILKGNIIPGNYSPRPKSLIMILSKSDKAYIKVIFYLENMFVIFHV